MSDRSEEPEYYSLEPEHVDPRRIKKEREKAKKLKASPWWQRKLREGLCHYCGGKFKPAELTMDHVVPLARGGVSTPGNLVAACRACNQSKKLKTPVEALLEKISRDAGKKEGES